MRPRFILASGSPRRRELLRKAGYQFDVISPPVEEVAHAWLTIRELTSWNAARKAAAVSRTMRQAVVLAADTLVTIDREVLGKPRDFEDAVRMLRRLSGRAHEVWTAVRINHADRGRARSFHEISRVYFRELDESAIRSYLAKIDPLDKAGAYAAQGHGAEIIERIEGSYTNVIGLPMEKTTRALRAFGITPSEIPNPKSSENPKSKSPKHSVDQPAHSAIVTLSRKQTSSLFPFGSSKNTA